MDEIGTHFDVHYYTPLGSPHRLTTKPKTHLRPHLPPTFFFPQRWELRTRPFLRTSEFLWQEGHTAHASHDEALGCAQEMLDVYADVCARMLAMPVVKGVKSPSERFAGADETFTIEVGRVVG